MCKVNACILMVVLALFTVAPAQEKVEQPLDQRLTVYLHPVSLIVFSAVEILPMYVIADIEKPTGPQSSVIFTPEYMGWHLESAGDKLDITSIGLSAALRKYLSKPQSGIYLQARAGLGYFGIDLKTTGDDASGSGIGGDILGYVGTKGKWDNISMFIDVGLGYQFSSVTVEAESSDIDESVSMTGLSYDANFGLGLSF